MSNDTLNWLIPLGVSIVAGLITYGSITGVTKQKLKNLEDDNKDLKSQVRELRDKTIACETVLKERGPVVQSNSPVSLTERGKKLLEESGGKSYIDSKKTDLIKKVRDNNPKSAYDVQEYAKKVIAECSTSQDFVPLKNYIYLQGEPLENLVATMGVYLRDLALPGLGFKIDEL